MGTVLVIFSFFWMDNDLVCAPPLPEWYDPLRWHHNYAHTLAHSSKTTDTIFMKLWDIVPNSIRVTNLHLKNIHFCCFCWAIPLKSSRKLVKHATSQVKVENEQSEPSIWWKIWRKVEKKFMSFCCKNGSVKLLCVKSSKKTSEPNLTKCRKGMNFQPLMNIWDLADVNTFWISWKMEWCPIWWFTDEKKFDVQQCLIH